MTAGHHRPHEGARPIEIITHPLAVQHRWLNRASEAAWEHTAGFPCLATDGRATAPAPSALQRSLRTYRRSILVRRGLTKHLLCNPWRFDGRIAQITLLSPPRSP